MPRRQDTLLASLSLAAGCVDAVGYLVGGAAELLWQPGALLLPMATVVAVVALMATRHREPRAPAGE